MYTPSYDPDTQALTFADESDKGPAGANAVFVCGALQDPARMTELIDRPAPFACGAVTGYFRGIAEIDGEEVAFMVADDDEPDRVLTGVIWLDLTDVDVAAIETLELDRGLRATVQVEVIVGDETILARTYVKK